MSDDDAQPRAVRRAHLAYTDALVVGGPWKVTPVPARGAGNERSVDIAAGQGVAGCLLTRSGR